MGNKTENFVIMTDDSCGIPLEEAKKLGIEIISIPFYIDGKLYHEGIDITAKEFFERMEDHPDMHFSTSMPTPGDILNEWKRLLKTYDAILYMPISSGLSNSTQTAESLAQDFEGKVQVVDNQRISVPLRQAILDAIHLKNAGKTAKETKEILLEQKHDNTIYLMVDTLEFLKRGGRVTPAAALLGGFLRIKPVLQIQGEKLDAFAKARSVKSAKKTMLEALRKDLDTRFKEYEAKGQMQLMVSYTHQDQSIIDSWIHEVEQAFPGHTVMHDPLPLFISCHTGPGVLGIGAARIVQPEDYE
ncbi:DegV family protein [Catenisphaera adipataccumulans]|uniref:DegV family protein with EDD domain n=1 Tax=Catenisphaera adipataccumulans TaxID=700500 RepID=A0A7W8D0F8_9FIRM|nr:DegV family protein [Catenisphaera adipataccumulans]MBB5183709.1 DegV family protein with EDD domain [Catenisphaera adipataccumulans]